MIDLRDEQRALLETVDMIRGFDWDMFLIRWCAFFQLVAALTIGFAPDSQVTTTGTAPIFEVAPRSFWSIGFGIACVAVLAAFRWGGQHVRLAAWLWVLFLGGMWLTASSLAVLSGRGSAVGVVVWLFLYGPWVVVSVRLARGKR